MCEVNKGEKYVVLIHNDDGSVSFKDVICESEVTNFQIPQMEIETTEGEYYPLYNVFKTKEAAKNDYKKSLMNTIKSLKQNIKDKEIDIIKTKQIIENFEKQLKSLYSVENEKSKRYILCEFQYKEIYVDRWDPYVETSFIPYKNLSFDTLEEAQKYVFDHIEDFKSKIYCKDTVTNKIKKMKKMKMN